LLCLKYLSNPESGQTTTAVLLLGLVLGMAGLAKMTALGMLPAVFLMLVIVWSNAGARPRTERVTLLIAACAVVFSLAFLVCGWFYVRNWLVLGRPFWGGWEPERQILWWQYPGYRTFAQFARFGECMTYPILSGLNSLWDGFYSTLWLDGYTSSMVDPDFPPPWNFDFMLSGAWLALVPSLVMGGGLAAVFLTKEAALRRIGVFATSCLVLYIAALVYGFLTVPYYCVVKASYTLGLVPCYAILLTAGLRLCRTPVVKGIVLGGLAAWGAAAYAAYFIL
jgi:4-amino-4-deoxy-L-arabinose transferase-like glycosyltransferase